MISRSSLNERSVTLTIAIFAIISAAMETDLFVPSFPALKAYFHTSEEAVQLLLTSNFVGLCLAGLFYGPLSDSYGRKPILLFGMSIFAIAAIGCSMANTIESLIFWRFAQGIGCSVAFVVPGAIIYDLYSPEEAARVMSFYNTVITTVMAGAPIIGSILYLRYGWHANFLFIAVVASIVWLLILFFVTETHPKTERPSFAAKSILRNYWQICCNPEAQANIAIVCCVFGGYLVFIANISLIFIEHLHVDKATFGWYQASILLTFAVVSLKAQAIMDKFGMEKARIFGKLSSFTGAVLLLLVSQTAADNPILITASMAIFTGGFAFMVSIIFGDYMALFPKIRGLAMAFSSAERLLFIGMAISLSGALFTGSIVPVALIIFALSSIATVFTFALIWHRQRRENSAS